MWPFTKNMKGRDLRGAVLRGKDLANVNLTNASLKGADLTGTDWEEAILTNVDLTDARPARTVQPLRARTTTGSCGD